MCGIIGVIDKRRQCMDGSGIRNALALMDERGNGEGAGYVAYGIYPDFADAYALHVFFDHIHENKPALDAELEKWGTIVHDEEIPTYASKIKKVHTPWRYFFKPDPEDDTGTEYPADDIVMHIVMSVNTAHNGTLIFSSGKNLGVFKASGWPEEVADLYRIQDYKGYLWLAHNRYPTNTAGWWGGAHPFNLLGLERRPQRGDHLVRDQPALYRELRVQMHNVHRYRSRRLSRRPAGPETRPIRENGSPGARSPVLGRDRPDAGKGAGTQPCNPADLWPGPHERSVCDLRRQREHRSSGSPTGSNSARWSPANMVTGSTYRAKKLRSAGLNRISRMSTCQKPANR